MVTEVVEIVLRDRGFAGAARGLGRVSRAALAAASSVTHLQAQTRNADGTFGRLERTTLGRLVDRFVAVGRVGQRSLTLVGRAINRLTPRVSRLQGLVGGLGAGFAAFQTIRVADEFTRISRAVQQSTQATGDTLAVQAELLEIANRTTTSLSDNAALFQRLSVATRDLGASNREVLDVVEGLNSALILSGASSAEAQGGLIQLGQGLASGRLAGDELRGVLEALPQLAQALSAELGEELGGNIDVTVGRLRELGAEGQLTGDVVFPALQRAVAGFSAELANTTRTVGETTNVLRNEFTAVIGELNNEVGGTGGLNAIILDLARNLRGILLTSAALLADGLAITGNAVLAIIESFLDVTETVRNVIGAFLDFRLSLAEIDQAIAEADFTGLIISDETLQAARDRTQRLRQDVDDFAASTGEAARENDALRATLDGISERTGALRRTADAIREIRDAGRQSAEALGGVSTESRAPAGRGTNFSALAAIAGRGTQTEEQQNALVQLIGLQRQLNREAAAERGERQLAIFDLREQIDEARSLAEIAGQDPAGSAVVRELEEQLARLQSQTDFGAGLAASITGSLEGAFQAAIVDGANFADAFGEGLEAAANQALLDGLGSGLDALQEGLQGAFDSVAGGLFEEGGAFGGLGEEFGNAIGGALQFLALQGLSALIGGTNAGQRAGAVTQSAVTSTQAVRGIVAGPQQIAIAQVGDNIASAIEPLIEGQFLGNSLLADIRDSLQGAGAAAGGAVGSSDLEAAAFENASPQP